MTSCSWITNTRPIYMQIVGANPAENPGRCFMEGRAASIGTGMAMELAINPNTMQRAYRELEVQGWIYSVPGKGSYVCDIARAARPAARACCVAGPFGGGLVSLGYDRGR